MMDVESTGKRSTLKKPCGTFSLIGAQVEQDDGNINTCTTNGFEKDQESVGPFGLLVV